MNDSNTTPPRPPSPEPAHPIIQIMDFLDVLDPPNKARCAEHYDYDLHSRHRAAHKEMERIHQMPDEATRFEWLGAMEMRFSRKDWCLGYSEDEVAGLVYDGPLRHEVIARDRALMERYAK